MLYWLFELLREFDAPGSGLLDYLSVRAVGAFVLALLIAIVFGRRIIDKLQLMQVGEIIRDLGLEGQMKKTGTPTMGGIIIIISTVVPCLLVGNLSNIYMILMLVSTVWLGSLGFLDDYLKIHAHNKDGLNGKFKIIGQVGLGLIVGLTMFFSPAITISEGATVQSFGSNGNPVTEISYNGNDHQVKTPATTIPFVKNNNFNYKWLTQWMGHGAHMAGWVVFILVVIFLVTATSNGANLTDGLDGLTTGCSAIIGTVLLAMAYLGGNVIYSTYLNIMYIPASGELTVYMAAFIGALIGFLWYNAYPAQVFMGDTGSLTLGGIIAVFAVLIHKELLLPILCAIFYIEDLSVMLQVGWFKWTKRRNGTGQRIFKMTPLHHHFQKAGGTVEAIIQKPFAAVPESRIVIRFWIICILLAAATFVTLKIR